jgi:pyridoxal phosphate enzyme (YggS family)
VAAAVRKGEIGVSSIGENLKNIFESIDAALFRTGRTDTVTIVAAGKTVPAERLETALAEGISIIGENRVQEAVQKYGRIGGRAHWHMIGHLQRNKVKQALEVFEMVQSIDRVETAAEIEKRAQNPIDILVEINSSGEESKSGVHPDNVFQLIDRLLGFKMLNIRGLMTIGPFTEDEEMIRNSFSLTRKKYEELSQRYEGLQIDTLSMGMSGDYRIAIEEGSNMVRLGTALFGARRY